MNYYQLVAEVSSYTQNVFSTADINTFIEQSEQRIFNTVQFPSIRRNVTGSLTGNNPYLSCPPDFISVYSLAVIDGSGSYNYVINKDVNFIREAYPSPTLNADVPRYYAIYGPTFGVPTNLSLILGPTPDQSYVVEFHYFFYPPSIVPGEILTFSPVTGGSAYTNGTFYNATLTGGTGSNATGTVVVSGGAVTSFVPQSPGFGYVVGDVITYVDPNGVGVGATATVATVNNATGQSWLGDNYDMVLLYACLVEAYTFMKGEGDMLQLYETKYEDALGMAKRAGDALERTDSYRVPQYRQVVT